MSCDNCDFNVDTFKTQIQGVVVLFQQDISGIATGAKSATDLKDLFLAKSYVDGLKKIIEESDKTLKGVRNCIQCYKIQTENSGGKIENKETSVVMYSDTLKLIRINLFKTITLIIGIIMLSFFLYLNKNV